MKKRSEDGMKYEASAEDLAWDMEESCSIWLVSWARSGDCSEGAHPFDDLAEQMLEKMPQKGLDEFLMVLALKGLESGRGAKFLEILDRRGFSWSLPSDEEEARWAEAAKKVRAVDEHGFERWDWEVERLIAEGPGSGWCAMAVGGGSQEALEWLERRLGPKFLRESDKSPGLGAELPWSRGWKGLPEKAVEALDGAAAKNPEIELAVELAKALMSAMGKDSERMRPKKELSKMGKHPLCLAVETGNRRAFEFLEGKLDWSESNPWLWHGLCRSAVVGGSGWFFDEAGKAGLDAGGSEGAKEGWGDALFDALASSSFDARLKALREGEGSPIWSAMKGDDVAALALAERLFEDGVGDRGIRTKLVARLGSAIRSGLLPVGEVGRKELAEKVGLWCAGTGPETSEALKGFRDAWEQALGDWLSPLPRRRTLKA